MPFGKQTWQLEIHSKFGGFNQKIILYINNGVLSIAVFDYPRVWFPGKTIQRGAPVRDSKWCGSPEDSAPSFQKAPKIHEPCGSPCDHKNPSPNLGDFFILIFPIPLQIQIGIYLLILSYIYASYAWVLGHKYHQISMPSQYYMILWYCPPAISGSSCEDAMAEGVAHGHGHFARLSVQVKECGRRRDGTIWAEKMDSDYTMI